MSLNFSFCCMHPRIPATLKLRHEPTLLLWELWEEHTLHHYEVATRDLSRDPKNSPLVLQLETFCSTKKFGEGSSPRALELHLTALEVSRLHRGKAKGKSG